MMRQKNLLDQYELYNNALLVEMLGDISYVRSDISKAKKYYESCLKLEITPNNRKIIENKLNSIQ